ncbi:uncharacterized protein BDW70DRAFT_15316 [Aspergillus foveolatus]|uniref:uncharacterized protein n=1 Tax=Aspergillus foveolatus TaxID=210207 RepID=UPI003CCD878A
MSHRFPLRPWALRMLNSDAASFRPSNPTSRMLRRPISLAPAQRQLFNNRKQLPSLRKLQQLQLQSTAFRGQIRRTFRTYRPRFNTNKSVGPGYTYQAPNATPSLSQRLKTLSREYGWSALWIYLFLSALDFPFCFAAVKLLGADKIGHYEHVIVESVKGAMNKVWPGAFRESEEQSEDEDAEAQAGGKKKGSVEEASLWTQLALAYAIHKSFIFVRVPLTAAITPKVVKQLRKWGWDVVKGKPKAK